MRKSLKSLRVNARLLFVNKLPEIEAAVDALPVMQQRELLRRLAQRLDHQEEPNGHLPLVAPTGNPITQEDIDNALDTD